MAKEKNEEYLDSLLNNEDNSTDDFLNDFEKDLADVNEDFLSDFENELHGEIESDNEGNINDKFSLEKEIIKEPEINNNELDNNEPNESVEDIVSDMGLNDILSGAGFLEDDGEDSELSFGEKIQENSESFSSDDIQDDEVLSLLDGIEDKDLSDIGDMLKMDESNTPIEGSGLDLDNLDNLLNDDNSETDSVFLDSSDMLDETGLLDELELNQLSESGNNNESEPKHKKVSFFKKLFGKKEKPQKQDEIFEDENDALLREMDEHDAKEEKERKKKEKKAEKEKKKKEKKEKKAAESKKVKKPKSPAPVEDPMPPLPKVKVILTILMAVSFLVLFFIGMNYLAYTTSINEANDYYAKNDYYQAYARLDGVKIKEKDQEFYNNLQSLAKVSCEYRRYNSFKKIKLYPEALDALLCGIKQYDELISKEKDDVTKEKMKEIKKLIETSLSDDYNVSIDDARNINKLEEHEQYSAKVYDISDVLYNN